MNFDNPVYRKTTEEHFVKIEKCQGGRGTDYPSVIKLTLPQ
jgi:hypothetical protein